MDTKKDIEKSHARMPKIPLNNHFIVPLNGSNGGLWLICSNKRIINVLSKDGHCIQVEVPSFNILDYQVILFIHAPCKPAI